MLSTITEVIGILEHVRKLSLDTQGKPKGIQVQENP